jgi:hypothetical protein
LLKPELASMGEFDVDENIGGWAVSPPLETGRLAGELAAGWVGVGGEVVVAVGGGGGVVGGGALQKANAAGSGGCERARLGAEPQSPAKTEGRQAK